MLLFCILILFLIVGTVRLFIRKEIKKAIRLGIICLSILVLNLSFMITDINLIKNEKEPIFSIVTAQLNDGGSALYKSIGYSIFKVKRLWSETKNNNEINGYKKGYELRIANITVFEDTVFVPIEK